MKSRRFKGAMVDLVPDLVIQVDDRSIFSASTEPNWQDTAVLELLNHQFTCTMLQGGRHGFCFYKDRGDTWQFKP